MTEYNSVSPRLPTSDLLGTVQFYRDRLGFRPTLLWPDDGPTFAILIRGETELQFDAAVDQAGDSARTLTVGDATLVLEVTGVESLHKALSADMPIEWGPEVYWYGRREFAVRDPNGYLLIFTESTDDPATCEG